MISVEVGMDDLVQVRFTKDAVRETAASLTVLARPGLHALHTRLRHRLSSQPRFDMDLLLELLADPRWVPNLLSPQPMAKPTSPGEQFDRLHDTDPAVLASDLEAIRRRNPSGRAARMGTHELLERTTVSLAAYWRQVLEPLWERVDAIVGADIARMGTAVANEGIGRAIGRVHADLSYADGEIRVASYATELRVAGSGHGVWLVPLVFRWPWVSVDVNGQRPVISYPARGAGLIWKTHSAESGSRLSTLLGRSRAAVLRELDIPRTTTDLAERLSLSPGTVSEHLSILSSSGLLIARREGRRVLYERTGLAVTLLAETRPLTPTQLPWRADADVARSDRGRSKLGRL